MASKTRLRTVLLLLAAGIALWSFDSIATRGADETGGAGVSEKTELKIYEAAVTVSDKIQCRKYEGKVLNCTLDPRKTVNRALDVKLILGYASVQIDGNRFKALQEEDGSVRFYPDHQVSRKDYTGEHEVTIGVIYVE
jgi:hypothetical protein